MVLNKISFFKGYVIVFGSAIFSVIILQLLIFPTIFHNFSDIYIEFMKNYYNYSIASIILNTIAFYQYKKYYVNYLLFYIFYAFFILYLVLVNQDIVIVIFAASIFFYEIVKNILRIKKQDLALSILFPLNMLFIFLSLYFTDPYFAVIAINSIFSLGIFFYYKMYMISYAEIPINQLFYHSLDIVLNILNKDLDKILVLNFLINKDSNTLTFIIVFGLILMPIQLLGKYLVTEDRYNQFFTLKNISFFVLSLATISVLASVFIITYFYHIDILPYVNILILIILTKIIYSIGYLLFSKQENEYHLKLVGIKFILLILLLVIVYSIKPSLDILLLCYLVYLISFYSVDYLFYRKVRT